MSDIAKFTETIMRRALKELDMTHIDATICLTATLSGILKYLSDNNLLEDLSNIYEPGSKEHSCFRDCLFTTLDIITMSQKHILSYEKSDQPKI